MTTESLEKVALPRRAQSRLSAWRWWLAAALLLMFAPLVFRSGTALTMMSLMGIAVLFALSYNMLLGETGMLSFGHAVYYGLGAYGTVHVVNAVIAKGLPVPLFLMPLFGGAAGLFFAALFGWASTKRSGTAFAMISLGLAELVGSSSLILRSFFGGEEGITTNRTKVFRVLGLGFGPQIEVYYLIAAWTLMCAGLIYAITRTPLGRMCNAIRDNPERVAFVGYDPHVVRYLAFCLSGFFAGIAGALAVIHFELANAALFGAAQSGNVLLATFIGGAGHFGGPVIGAILVTYLQTMLSDVTEVWQLYFGLLFMAAVLYAPGGIAGLLARHAPLMNARGLRLILPAYALMVLPVALAAGGAILAIELAAHLGTRSAERWMRWGPIAINAESWSVWLVAFAAVVFGGMLSRLAARRFAAAWQSALLSARASPQERKT